jgi:pentatricopeptide repeat protein
MPEGKVITAWNAMITAYAKNDCQGEAVGLFLVMLRSAVSPDCTTLISVLVTPKSTAGAGKIRGMATKIGLL